MKTRVSVSLIGALAAVTLLGGAMLHAGTFTSDFASGVPAGSTAYGGGVVGDGVLKLTTAANYQTGSLILDDLDSGEFVKAFTASFKLKIGGGTGGDGLSFIFGPLIPGAAFGHEGSSDRGLVISFDTRDNGGGEAPAIDVFRGGFLIASCQTDVLTLLRTGTFQQVTITVDAEGRLSLKVGGTAVFSNLRGAFVPTFGRFALGAYCGNLNDNHWVDDLNINTTPAAAGDLPAVDVEMFDTGGGGTLAAVSTMPYAGDEYAGLPATHEIDYREDVSQGDQNNYRTTESPNVPMLADVAIAPWTKRPGFTVTTNHRFGWTGVGEWYHYTRTFPAGHYRVVVAASHVGSGASDIRGRLHLLVDGQGTNQPRLWEVGGVSGYGSGAWARNNFLTVKRTDGSDAVVQLPGGQVTLRYAPESGDSDWFMLVPVSAPPPAADLLVRQGTSRAFAGDNVFQVIPSGAQVVDATATPWATTTFEVRVSNDSAAPKALTVRALESGGTGWTISCQVGTTEVKTALFAADGYATAELAAGASETITITMTPDAAVSPASLKRLTFGVFDDSEVTTPRDSVRVEGAVAGLTSGRQGMAFSYQAEGPVGSTFAAAGLPAELTIDPVTGLITGTPGQAGTYVAVVTTTHAQGVSHRTLRIVVGNPIPADGLLSGWLAEGDAADAFGPHPGTLQGGVAFLPGPVGQAFSFDGSNDCVDLGAWFDLPAFTMAFWVRPEATQATYADIMDNNHDSSSNWVLQYANSSDTAGTNWNWSLQGMGNAVIKLSHQTWQHLAVAVDGSGGAKYYLNGREVGNISGTAAVNYNSSRFLRFGRWGGGGRYFRGALDDVLLYNRPLTPAEVSALVNSSARTPDSAEGGMAVRAGTTGDFLGDDIYEIVSSAAQTAGADATPATPAAFQVLLRNESDHARSFRVLPTVGAGTGWTITCGVDGTDITPYLFSPPYYTSAMLAPGATEVIRVELTPNRLAPVGAVKRLELQLVSNDPGCAPLDSVRVEATVTGLARPDLLVRRPGDATNTGDNIYNTSADGQRRRQRVGPGETATYIVPLTNDGNTAEQLLVQGTAATAGWTVSYLHERNYANFDGSNDYINLGNWGPGTKWTTEAWVRPTALPAGRHSIIGGFAEGRDWGVTLQEGKLGVAFKPISGASTLTQQAPDPAVIGQWIHVAGTCDGTTARLYLNGTEVASALVQVDYLGTTAGARIGGEACCGANCFPGQIRDVRVWSHARTQAEITAAMNAELTGAETGLLGYWRLDEESGTALLDMGPNDHHGSFVNGAGWLLMEQDVTAAVTGGGFLTPPVLPSDTIGRTLRVQVTPDVTAADGESLDLLVSGAAHSDASKVDAVRMITHVSGPTAGGIPLSASYSTDAEFEFGVLTGVENETTADQLQLSVQRAALPFLWVPNSNEGTISKVDTRDGRELGRYRVCPSSVYGNPSRTTIDQIGNCWVGNRRTGTVVKVGLLENGQWLDRNQNGLADTSRDLNNDGVITGTELLAWGEDECVLVETVLIPGREGAFAPGDYTGGYANNDLNPGPRSLAVDATGNLWVGSYGLRMFHYVDGETGEIQRSVDVSSVNHTPYGALIDGQGIVWSSSQDKAHVLRLDPATDTFTTVQLPAQLYGLGIDANHQLFASGWQSSKLYRINTLTSTLEWTRPASYESRGVAVTADGDVWTADTSPATVSRFSNNGALKATIAVGSQPTGVAVDAAGRVWVVHFNDESVRRIDPATNTVDLVKNLPGTRHYGYSDMTGIVARNATTRFGYWSVVHDSKIDHTVWTMVDWTAVTPAGTGLTVRVRSSDDGARWSFWETAADGLNLVTTPPGRYLEIKVEFRAPTGADSPVLQDIAVTAVAPGDTDLAVTKTCLTAQPRAEHEQVYQITIANNGTEWASNVVATDTLPAGFELLSISIPGGSYAVDAGVLTARYAGLAPGESAVFTVTGVPWIPGSNSNAVVVAADRPDTDASDNQFTLVTEVAALECGPVPPGLLAWWPGNGSPDELVAGRNLGDWYGAKYGTGRVGQGFLLDGNDDFFELPDAGMIHSDRGITVTGWFKATGFHRTWQCLYYKGNPAENGAANDNRETSLFLNSAGYLHFNSTTTDRIGIGQFTLDTANIIKAGKWYHFATVADCDRGVMEIWLNGERVAQAAYPRTAVRTTEGPFRIGVNVPAGEVFRGVIDEIAVFGRGLSESEINAAYDVRSAGLCAGLPVIAAPAMLPPGIAGVAYSQALTARLGEPPYTWSLVAGSPPDGLALTADGTLAGTPAAAGSATFTVRVTDHAAQTADRQYTLAVGTCLTPGAGLAALWSGEGNGDDSIGTSHGSVGPMVYYVPGMKGRAFHFIDNSQSYVNFPNSAALQVPTADPQFSIEAWIKPDYNVTGDKIDTILSKRDGCSGNYSYVFTLLKGHRGYLGNIALSITGVPGLGFAVSTTTVPADGQFHHVVATYQHDKAADNIMLWIDGQSAGTLTTTAIPPVTGEGPISGRHGSCGYYSTASMDEIAFHQVALTETEIQARYAAGAAGYCDLPDADLLVKTAAEPPAAYLTDELRESGPPTVQVKSAAVAPLSTADFDVMIQNDSAVERAFVLRAFETGSAGWNRSYQGPGGDISTAIKGAGGYATPLLAPGGSEVITVHLSPGTSVTGGFTMTSTITAHRDGTARGARDGVMVKATCTGTALTDMLVRRAADVVFLGDDIRNADGTRQTKTTEIAAGEAARFFARVANDGNLPTRFRLRTVAPAGDWAFQCTGPEPGLNFDGVNDAVRIPDAPALRPTSLTAEGWFLATATNGQRHFISKAFGSSTWNSYVVWIENGTLYAGVMNDTGRLDRLSFNWNTLPSGWHHVALTFDADTDDLRLFVDGTQQGRTTSNVDIAYDAHPVLIGSDMVGLGLSGLLAGQAREVRLWNRVRTPAEIQATMDLILTGTEGDLIGVWPLTEGTGLVANDLTGNHPGELINGTAWLFTGSSDLTSEVTSPDGWVEVVLSPGQAYDLGVTLTAAPEAPAGSRCEVLLEGSNVTGSPATTDVVRLVAVVESESSGKPKWRVFTDNEDFDQGTGTLVGVEFTSVANQLQLGETAVTLPFLWVPNSNQGTISKVDTRTGFEVGRYRVCPNTVYGNPSRTTVDLSGNCWVGNRRIGTAVKVGLLESGGYVDRNHDGIIQTSRDTNGNGVIEGAELLAWGEDECVIHEVVVIPGKEGTFDPGAFTAGYANDDWNPGPRGIAIDAAGDLWLGSFGLRKYHKINSVTGEILKAVDVSSVNHTPYGAVIDRNGVLWSSGSDKQHVLRLDPLTETYQAIALGHYSYGLALDNSGHLFVSGWQNTKLTRINTTTNVKDWTLNGVYESRGVAVTADGDVWTANSGPGTVTRFSNDGAIKATIEVGNTPTGVAVDADGKVWVVNNGDEYVKRIDPTTNTVDLAKALPAGTNHYGYSDMTGMVARNATTRFGTWTVTHDSKVTGTVWDKIGWNSVEPDGQGLSISVRTSEDGVNWSAWTSVPNGASLGGLPAGRYLQITVRFQVVLTGEGERSPVLYDLFVQPLGGGPVLEISLGTGGKLVLTGEGSPDEWILERSQHLTDGTWQEVPFTAVPVPGGFTIERSQDGPRAFYRLRHK